MLTGNDICMNCMYPHNGIGRCRNCGFDINEYEDSEQYLPMGTVLYGSYMIGRVLGTGGFGITYVGLELKKHRRVAIKEFYLTGHVIRNNKVSNDVTPIFPSDRELFETNREKFVKEAQILSEFNGEEGIASVFLFFRANNTAYIVMEFVEGETLKQILDRRGRLGYRDSVNILIPVMRSLDKIHQTKLLHRDISPDNIMVSGMGKVKLLDFGAARNFTESNEKGITVMLKVGYAPYEQYRTNGKQGPWTDVYAICATLYKCITGVTPDNANDRSHFDTLKTPGQLGIIIPATVENAIMRGLAVYEGDRTQTVADLMLEISNPVECDRIYPLKKEEKKEK